MRFVRGLLLAASRLWDSATPGKIFSMNRAKNFASNIVLESSEGSLPEVVSARLRKTLNSLYITLADSRQSEWFFHDFGHRLEDSRHNFHWVKSSKFKPEEYFFSTLDDSRHASRPINFAIYVLAFTKVNVLKEIDGWIEDQVRQRLLARLLSFSSLVGINRISLGRLFQNSEKLETKKLQSFKSAGLAG